MAKVKAPKVPLTEVTTATEDDVSRLLRACSTWRTFTNARDTALISLLFATGLRRTEMANLKLPDIDLDTMTLVVRRSKNGTARRVPCDQRAAQHVLRYLAKRPTYPVQDPEALWLGKRGPLTSDGIRQVLERRRREAKVTISAHSFRRGLTARAMRAGVTTASTMSIMGWKTDMSGRYSRMVASEVAMTEYRNKLG